jgi:hypothetical protein
MIPANPGNWLPMETRMLVFVLRIGSHLKIPCLLARRF